MVDTCKPRDCVAGQAGIELTNYEFSQSVERERSKPQRSQALIFSRNTVLDQFREF